MTIPTTVERIARVEDAREAVIRAARAVLATMPTTESVALAFALDNYDDALEELAERGEGYAHFPIQDGTASRDRWKGSQ